jgi:hypothetical protein
VRGQNATSPNDEELAVGIADVALADDQGHLARGRINAEYLRDLGADVGVDLDRRLVERPVGVDRVALDRNRRVGDSVNRLLVDRVGVGVIVARSRPVGELEELNRIAELAATLIGVERH